MGAAPASRTCWRLVAARRLDRGHGHPGPSGVGGSVHRRPAAAHPLLLDTLLDEFTRPGHAFRVGVRGGRAAGGARGGRLRAAGGTRTAFTTLHSEVATLPRAFPDARRSVQVSRSSRTSWIGSDAGRDGPGLEGPHRRAWQQVRPRDVLLRWPERLRACRGRGGRGTCPSGAGTGNATARRPRWWPRPCPAQPRPGVGGGALDTGAPPSIVAQMIAAGEVRGPGMFAPRRRWTRPVLRPPGVRGSRTRSRTSRWSRRGPLRQTEGDPPPRRAFVTSGEGSGPWTTYPMRGPSCSPLRQADRPVRTRERVLRGQPVPPPGTRWSGAT